MRASALSLALAGALSPLALVSPAIAQQSDTSASPLAHIAWIAGPAVARLGDVAELRVPESCRFTDAKGARQFMEATHNPPSDDELGVLLCRNDADSTRWFVVFEYNAIGLVKDDEKTSLDQAAILKTIRSGTEAGNEERRERGWAEIEVTGWERAPYYDSLTHNLTWATRLRRKNAPDDQTINHSVRLLGRGGVMNADLVADPAQMGSAVEAFDTILKDYTFVSGQRYSEWRSGDKVAQYGLTALIAGGAGVAAAKLGLFGKLWKLILYAALALKKLIIVAVVGVAGFVKRLFGKKDDGAAPQPQG